MVSVLQLKVHLPNEPACPSVEWLVRRSVCLNFLKGQEVTLPCSYWGIYWISCWFHSYRYVRDGVGLPYLPTYLQTYLTTYFLHLFQPTYLPTYQPTNLPNYQPTKLPPCQLTNLQLTILLNNITIFKSTGLIWKIWVG